MLNNRIVINKTFLTKFKNFWYNPITALVFSVASGFYFYYISLSEKEPSYFYTNPQLVAEKANGDLKIMYNNLEVKNVYLTNLLIWNNGKDYIDNNDFIESKPIKFYSNKNIKLLSASVNKKSRSDINFKNYIKNDTLFISIEGDEAIEQGDGVNFHILFSNNLKENKNNDIKFYLASRVKGTKGGFKYLNVNNFDKQKTFETIVFLWSTIIILLLIRIIALLIYKKDIVFRKNELIFFVVAISFTIYLTIQYVYYTAHVNWL